MPKKAVRSIDDELKALRARQDALAQKCAEIDALIKPLEQTRDRIEDEASGVNEAIGELLIKKWGNEPDWRHILDVDHEGGSIVYRYGQEMLSRLGLQFGMAWADTKEYVIAFGLNRYDHQQLRQVETSLRYIARFMRRRRGNVVWFTVHHHDSEHSAWTLIYNVIHETATLEQHVRMHVAERLKFKTLRASLAHVQTHLWFENEMVADLADDTNVFEGEVIDREPPTPHGPFKVEMTEAGRQLVMFP
jgi:cell division protein FtsB